MAEITVDLAPQVINFVGIPLGDDFSTTMTLTETIAGVPTAFNWTGATVDASIVASLQPGAAALMTLTDVHPVTGAGNLAVSATDGELITLGVGSYYYKIKVTKSNFTRTYFCGVFQIVRR